MRDGTEDAILGAVERFENLAGATLKTWTGTGAAAAQAWRSADDAADRARVAVADTAAAWQRAAKAAEWAMWAILGLSVLSAGLDVWRALRDD